MAGTDDGDAVVIADGVGGPARADTATETFADDLAAAHDDCRRAAAGLREHWARADQHGERNADQAYSNSTSKGVLHNNLASNDSGLNLAARSIGTNRADDAARFASSPALVKRRILGLLHGVALNQRP